MMRHVVKAEDIDSIEVPNGYEVLDATAEARRLGLQRDTVLAYLSRRNFRRIPAQTGSSPWGRYGTKPP